VVNRVPLDFRFKEDGDKPTFDLPFSSQIEVMNMGLSD
jgi:hypothetical protein